MGGICIRCGALRAGDGEGVPGSGIGGAGAAGGGGGGVCLSYIHRSLEVSHHEAERLRQASAVLCCAEQRSLGVHFVEAGSGLSSHCCKWG